MSRRQSVGVLSSHEADLSPSKINVRGCVYSESLSRGCAVQCTLCGVVYARADCGRRADRRINKCRHRHRRRLCRP